MKATMTDIIAYYRKHDRKYLTTDKARIMEFSRLYALDKRYFGQKVLDIACGGGVLGFVLEQAGHNYTGVDVNPDMISLARAHARKLGSGNRFILADATRMRLEGTFDTVCLLGNAMCHFCTHDFARILQNTAPHVERGAHFIVDYRDLVDLMFKKQWNSNSRLVQKDQGRMSATTGCDTKTGFVLVNTTDLHGKDQVKFAHAIWSPFIVEPIMNDHGWTLVKRRLSKRWSTRHGWIGWLDIYRRVER
jgi:SAM-dependent methyltransferase